MFKLNNGPHEKGDYLFCGVAYPSAKIEKQLSQQEIDEIKQQIKDYTKEASRPQELTFINESTGETIYAIDHLSITDFKSDDFQKFSLKKLQAHCLNYYTLVFEGELPF